MFQIITVSGFIGEEREDIKDLIRICGASFTGHLTPHNTHLICQRFEVLALPFLTSKKPTGCQISESH